MRRDTIPHFATDLDHWPREIYNLIRPHEALGDKPPLTRFRPSPRPRPPKLPEVVYPPDAAVRLVSSTGFIRWLNYRIQTGAGLARQWVRVEDRDSEVALFYAWKEIRVIAISTLRADTLN